RREVTSGRQPGEGPQHRDQLLALVGLDELRVDQAEVPIHGPIHRLRPRLLALQLRKVTCGVAEEHDFPDGAPGGLELGADLGLESRLGCLSFPGRLRMRKALYPLEGPGRWVG